MNMNISYIILFFIIGVGLPVLSLSMGRFLRPSLETSTKTITYESGADPIGEGWMQFNVRYYLFALLFVIFDVESVFLYPWAVVYDSLRAELGLFTLYEMFFFLFVLLVGLIYAWKKKVLEWE